MGFSEFSGSNRTQACGNGKDISNRIPGILKALALHHAVWWACSSSKHRHMRWETFPRAASHQRAQTAHQAGNLGLNPFCSTNYPISLGKLLHNPGPRLLCLENGDKSTYLTGVQMHLAQGLGAF